jgi:hypothetical protein
MAKSEHAPTFWMTGELTGGELRVADSTAGLIASILEGYGAMPMVPESTGEPGSMFLTWNQIKQSDRFSFACQIAEHWQKRALTQGQQSGTWSIDAETPENLDRLYAARHLVPDGGKWQAGGMTLVLVHPILDGLRWDAPDANRSLVVIDPRKEVTLLQGLEACGALDSCGRLDLASRVRDPRDQ